MTERRDCRVNVNHHPALGGMFWFAGWLFTIGYLHLPFWRAVLGVIIWPYFLGAFFAAK